MLDRKEVMEMNQWILSLGYHEKERHILIAITRPCLR